MRLVENILRMSMGGMNNTKAESFKNIVNGCNNVNTIPVPNTHPHANLDNSNNNAIFLLLLVLTYLVLLLFVGLFLYNQVLCKTVPAIKPLDNIWQLLGLAILFELIM